MTSVSYLSRAGFEGGTGGRARGELLPFRASSPRQLLCVPLYEVCYGISPFCMKHIESNCDYILLSSPSCPSAIRHQECLVWSESAVSTSVYPSQWKSTT